MTGVSMRMRGVPMAEVSIRGRGVSNVVGFNIKAGLILAGMRVEARLTRMGGVIT